MKSAMLLLPALAQGYQLGFGAAVAVRGAARCSSPLAKEEPEKKKPGIDFSGLAQLMAMGAGAPMLGDLKETNFNDPTKPDLMFELEANNFSDEKGDLKKGTYFDDGYVADDAEEGPGFFENLLSGGRLQKEFDDRKRRGS